MGCWHVGNNPNSKATGAVKFDISDDNCPKIEIFGHHINKWALWAIPTWSVYWLLNIFIHSIPSMVIRLVDFIFGVVPKGIINFADYIRLLQKYIVLAISSFLSYIFLSIFVPNPPNSGDPENKYLGYVFSTVLSTFVTCAIWAVEKIILQSFSVNRIKYNSII